MFNIDKSLEFGEKISILENSIWQQKIGRKMMQYPHSLSTCNHLNDEISTDYKKRTVLKENPVSIELSLVKVKK